MPNNNIKQSRLYLLTTEVSIKDMVSKNMKIQEYKNIWKVSALLFSLIKTGNSSSFTYVLLLTEKLQELILLVSARLASDNIFLKL